MYKINYFFKIPNTTNENIPHYFVTKKKETINNSYCRRKRKESKDRSFNLLPSLLHTRNHTLSFSPYISDVHSSRFAGDTLNGESHPPIKTFPTFFYFLRLL